MSLHTLHRAQGRPRRDFTSTILETVWIKAARMAEAVSCYGDEHTASFRNLWVSHVS